MSVNRGFIELEAERYARAAHRVQSCIAALNQNAGIMSHKHMRVGIDMSKADQSGLAKLLLAKGVFTIEEYHTAIADAAEEEANRWETELSVSAGINIKSF